MTDIAIQAATAEEASEIGRRLRQFNHAAIGEYGIEPLRLIARAPDGRMLGGLTGQLVMEWLAIGVLWVAEDARGQGLGSRLLAQAEAQARAQGAHGAYLDTFAWQAAPFYARHGYVEFGRLDDFPAGSYRVFMRKRL